MPIASRNIVDWLRILLSGLPIGYGEAAVVHAGQLLARGEDPYALRSPDFVSANYPPLGYVLVALGLPLGPVTGLRLANILAACAVAAVTFRSARGCPGIGWIYQGGPPGGVPVLFGFMPAHRLIWARRASASARGPRPLEAVGLAT